MIDETADEAAERMERSMAGPKWTPGPWVLGEFSESGGYDCMTSGVSAGPASIDGASYGERRMGTITDEQKARMMADARLIAAAPELYDALARLLTWVKPLVSGTDREEIDSIEQACVALRKARGE